MTEKPAEAAVHHHPAPAEGGGEEVTRYTSYTVFRRLGGLVAEGEMPGESALAEAMAEAVALIEAEGVEILGWYDLTGFRAGDDLMLWLSSEDPAALQAALRSFEASAAASLLHREWAAVGVHRSAEFTRTHIPSFMDPKRTRKEWITVYPFVRSYDWYLLPDEERRELLIEHGKLGRDFPQVNANTVAAFALGDYEWLLSFEADDLHDLVDMMRHLRYSRARLHVRDELPFHAGRRLASHEDVAALLA